MIDNEINIVLAGLDEAVESSETGTRANMMSHTDELKTQARLQAQKFEDEMDIKAK